MELASRIGGSSKPKAAISRVFASPSRPSSATNPIATTMVGMMKGTVETALRTDLPGEVVPREEVGHRQPHRERQRGSRLPLATS